MKVFIKVAGTNTQGKTFSDPIEKEILVKFFKH
jgi:hypothetical protein